MLGDLVRKPQQAEHNYVWYLRIFVISVFLMILVGSFVTMCVRMAKENPTISTTFASVNSVLAPSVYLSFTYKFNISCWIYYDYKGSKFELSGLDR
jgi:ABC-type uncharacterized transport system permease subunit